MNKWGTIFLFCFTASHAQSPLPTPDFSHVDSCMQNMSDAYNKTEKDFFYKASQDWAGSIERGQEGDTCYQILRQLSACRITSRTNAGSWIGVNAFITDSFEERARSAITQAIEQYTHGQPIVEKPYITIFCQYRCADALDVSQNCRISSEK